MGAMVGPASAAAVAKRRATGPMTSAWTLVWTLGAGGPGAAGSRLGVGWCGCCGLDLPDPGQRHGVSPRPARPQ